MSSARRFSIRLLMTIILLIAVDFALVRALWGQDWGVSPGTALATLPMVNLLILTSPRLWSRRKSRFSWGRFAAVGWLLVAAVGYLSWRYPGTVFAPIIPLELNPPKWLGKGSSAMAVLVALIITLYPLPQLLLALLAGFLAGRYRVVIERRPAPDQAPAA